ncbi:phage holin family protein [Noviherbaspirillum sp. ST9]|uniref:phage holin family protein n=1 Tax=Noviherbaspirillum sp. ST9 TaxID=3401606 RepID=UPI003B58760E
MIIAESASRLAATLLAIVQNRVELASTELEEESLRYFSCLMLSLAAMFCLGIAVVLGVILAVVLYWDSHRVAILSVLIVMFGGAALAIAMRVRRQYQSKPRLLGHTMAELSRDSDLLQPRA